ILENYSRNPLPIYLFCIITFIFIEINHFLSLFVSISCSISRHLYNFRVKFFLFFFIFFHFFSFFSSSELKFQFVEKKKKKKFPTKSRFAVNKSMLKKNRYYAKLGGTRSA